MDSEKIRLPNEPETYLLTLYGKALDATVEHSILGDTFAAEAVRRIDFDFKTLGLPDGGAITLPMRAKHLDGWVREFLQANPESTVLHLGCGLDSRVYRIDPSATVRWFDIDRAEVIDLRQRLYPARHDYEMIATSVTDLAWLDRIPVDKPVLVVAEGLVQYLQENEAVALFQRITQTFPGGQFIFDAYSRFTTRLLSFVSKLGKKGINLTWGIDDPHLLEKQVPGLTLTDDIPFLTMPDLVTRLSHRWFQRVTLRLWGRVRFLRRSMLHLRYQFRKADTGVS